MNYGSKVLCPLLFGSLLLNADAAFAKRAAPEPVAPVSYNGITYSAPNRNGRASYVVASDSTGKELFRIKIFDTQINPNLEEDVQWVFITDLRISGGSLVVRDEKRRCYEVNFDTKTVRRKHCSLF